MNVKHLVCILPCGAEVFAVEPEEGAGLAPDGRADAKPRFSFGPNPYGRFCADCEPNGCPSLRLLGLFEGPESIWGEKVVRRGETAAPAIPESDGRDLGRGVGDVEGPHDQERLAKASAEKLKLLDGEFEAKYRRPLLKRILDAFRYPHEFKGYFCGLAEQAKKDGVDFHAAHSPETPLSPSSTK